MKLEIYKEKYLLKAEKRKAREEKKAARKRTGHRLLRSKGRPWYYRKR